MAFIILLIPQAMAVRVEIIVDGNIGGNVEYFEMDENVEGVQEFVLQWYNSQSISCSSIAEFDIYKEGELAGTTWSEKKVMMSGVSDSFYSYWIPDETGNYSLRIRIHHCHEIIETELMNFTVSSVPVPEEKIQIETKNMPDGLVQVKVLSPEDLKDVAVVPEDYPIGWIMSGKKIDLEAGREKTIFIEYEPPVWIKEDANIMAISLDGKTSSPKDRVVLEKKQSFMEEHGLIVMAALIILLVLSTVTNILILLKRRNLKHRKL